MKKLFIVTLLFIQNTLLGQSVTITPSGISPALSYPRLSYDELKVLANPNEGDLAYDLTFKCLRVYISNKWICTYQNPADLNPDAVILTTAGSQETISSNDIAIDSQGNILIVGSFMYPAQFGTVLLSKIGQARDIFLAKYNKSGQLLWVKVAGSADSSNDEAMRIALDANGNAFITGYFHGNAIFGNTTISSAGQEDAFLAKYDANGNLLWVNKAGGSNSDVGTGLAIDTNGSIYLSGYFSGTATFNNITKSTTNQYSNGFLAKYSSSGNIEWVTTASSNSTAYASKVQVDKDNNVYLLGSTHNGITIGSITKSHSPYAGYNTYLAKLNSSGIPQWIISPETNGDFVAKDLKVGKDSGVYITGNYSGRINWGNTGNYIEGISAIALAKCSTEGDFHWIKSINGNLANEVNSLSLTENNEIIIGGFYRGSSIFDSITLPQAHGYADFFVAKYNISGNVIWAKKGGTADYDFITSINSDENGGIFMTGYAKGDINFGNYIINSQGIFIGRIQE